MTPEAQDVRTVGHRQAIRPAAALITIVALMVLSVVLPVAAAEQPGGAGNIDAGRAVFANNCAACHGPSAGGGRAAPSLVGLYERRTVEEIETTLRQGRNRMPAFGATLSDAQIEDVMGFLAQVPGSDVETRHEPRMHRWGDDMMWDGTGGVFMVAWLLFGLLLIVLLVLGIVWLVRQVSSEGSRPDDHTGPPSSPHGSAREDLDGRYERGEISREEYRTIRDDLDG